VAPRALLLLVLCSGAAAAAPRSFGGLRIKPAGLEAPRRVAGQGQVTSVTAQRAYLDRGEDDGLAVGQKVQLLRGARAGSTCEIETLAPHVATCRGGAIRVGDRFAVDKRGGEKAPKAPAPPPLPEQLARQRSVLEDAEQPLVDFVGGKTLGQSGVSGEVALVHSSVAAFSTPGSAFHQERADVALYGRQLFGGLSFGANASAVLWSRRPSGFRSPHVAFAQLQVRELWAGWQFKNGAHFALGRLTPRKAPGVGLVDGGLFGWAAPSGALAVGAYGGAVPDPLTLTPLQGPFTAGAYLAARLGGENVKTMAFEPSLRLAWVGRGSAHRFETQALMRLWWGSRFDARLEAAAGFGAGAPQVPLDAVRLDLGGRIADLLRLRAAVRYSGGGDPWLGTAPIAPSQAVHADALAALELENGFTISLQGGVVTDLSTGLTQGRAGPELALPPIAGGLLGVALGYDEEFGWMPGRSGYVQASFRPVTRLNLWTRASVFHHTFAEGAEGLSGLDGALSLGVDLRVWRWFWVRGSGWARAGLSGKPVPAALQGQLALGATF
jgi:hypothetical protein